MTGLYLAEWSDVELEIRTAFRFDGVAALQAHEIDVLVTPDPVNLPDLEFHPVFDYELRLAVRQDHPLASHPFIEPADLIGEDLLTVPVDIERLDVYTRFLVPAACRPRRRVTLESTDLMLQLIAANRGVSVLPDWLVRESAAGMPITTVGVGANGLHKSINVGMRRSDAETDYFAGFLEVAELVGSEA